MTLRKSIKGFIDTIKFKVDLEKEPPTMAEITTYSKYLRWNDIAISWIFYFTLFLMALAAIGDLMPLFLTTSFTAILLLYCILFLHVDFKLLSEDSDPVLCIEYVDLIDKLESDSKAKQYHNKIVKMGRMPLLIEVEAIKNALECAKQERKVEAIKDAFERAQKERSMLFAKKEMDDLFKKTQSESKS